MTLFSERLKFLRERNNMTQKELAEQIGVSQQYYYKFEKGTGQPNMEVLFRLRHILNESLDFIVGYHLEDLRAENLYELYAESRKDREEAEDDLKYWEEKLNDTSNEDPQKYMKLAKDTKERINEYRAKENRAFNMFFEHMLTIPGCDEEYATKEYWIDKYKSYQQGNTRLYEEFMKEFDNL